MSAEHYFGGTIGSLSKKCGFFTLWSDREENFDQFEPHFLDYVEAWNTAKSRIDRQIISSSGDFYIDAIPETSLVLTTNRDWFTALHPSHPNVNLPNWVVGYVHQEGNYYVRDLHQMNFVLENTAHEAIHLLLPSELGIPHVGISKVWNSLVNEGLAVGLMQRRDDEWTRGELLSAQRPISAESIRERGIFFHDQRSPAENPAYQYCVWATEMLGTEMIPHLAPPGYAMQQFEAVCLATQLAYRQGVSLEDLMCDMEISWTSIDARIHETYLH